MGCDSTLLVSHTEFRFKVSNPFRLGRGLAPRLDSSNQKAGVNPPS